jgi:hypothetical protein
MTGLIWLVQLVHYPANRFIDPTLFTKYQRFHQVSITFIVGPIMVLEVFTGLHIVFFEEFSQSSLWNFFGLAVIWLSTVFFSIANHAKLEKTVDTKAMQRLVTTNWLRTIAWTLRSGLWIYVLIQWKLKLMSAA